MSNRTYGRALCAARGYALAAVGLLGSGVALAQPPNDECGTATALADGLNVGFTNVAATASAGVPAFSCGGLGPNSNDVWFTYTATCSGTLTFSLCAPGTASFDTVMEAYTGPCGALVSAGCDDDTCVVASQVTIPGVIAASAFTVRVGGFGGAAGTFDVNVTCTPPPPPPANDECATAIALVDGLNSGFTTVGTTPSGLPNPTCAGTTSFNNDVWFTYTATCSGAVTFSMCGPAVVYDSILQIYSGSCGSLTVLACDDDGCPTPPAFADFSIATSPAVTAGTTLIVRVGGFSATDVGAFQITVSCTVPTDDFGDASGSTLARHTSATVSEHLGTSVTAEAATVTPSWYGDAGDDGILSVSSLFPGSTSATIVVHAENLNGT
ncbi:MAG TPA: hypothetical protein VFI25_05645, partial [Planctomycetota bacterium]|nr:hypothetical protein [Planctomycetota bacterium]